VRTVRVSLSLSVPAALPIGRVSVPVGAAPVAVPAQALLAEVGVDSAVGRLTRVAFAATIEATCSALTAVAAGAENVTPEPCSAVAR